MADINDIAARLDRLTGDAERANNVIQAQRGPQTPDQPQISTLATQAGGFTRPGGTDQENFTPLQRAFDTLARTFRDFRHLGATDAMDSPQAYLRRQEIDRMGVKRYVVSDQQLEKMAQALIAAGGNPARSNLPALGDMTRSFHHNGGSSQGFTDAMRGLAGRFGNAGDGSGIIQKRALDATSGTALIRTDIEPVMHEGFLRKFPMFEAVATTPANGINHYWDNRTDPGTAVTISDLGDMSLVMSNSTYARANNSHIATIVSPRAIGLKYQYAVEQSGMTSFNLKGSDNLELMAAAFAIAKKAQSLTFQGNFSTAGKTASDEEGAYNVNDFDGLRSILKNYAVTKGGSQTYRDLIDQLVAQVLNTGTDADNMLVAGSVGFRRALNAELTSFYRLLERPAGGVDNNLSGNGLMTVADIMTKFVNIPSPDQLTGVGNYTLATVDTEDFFVLDMAQLIYAYLGSPTITTLELPVGFNNTLAQVYYPFLMIGLGVYLPQFCRKGRVAHQIV